MTMSSLDRRLRKIEDAARPPKGAFYVAWGHTPEQIEATIAEASRTGFLSTGDLVVRCAWPAGTHLPRSRWATNEMYALDRAEFGALMNEVDRLMEDWITALRAEARRRGEHVPTALDHEESDPGFYTDPAHKLTDVALFAEILAVPFSRDCASLSEERIARVVRYIRAVGSRATIRGHHPAHVPAMDDAARITKH